MGDVFRRLTRVSARLSTLARGPAIGLASFVFACGSVPGGPGLDASAAGDDAELPTAASDSGGVVELQDADGGASDASAGVLRRGVTGALLNGEIEIAVWRGSGAAPDANATVILQSGERLGPLATPATFRSDGIVGSVGVELEFNGFVQRWTGVTRASLVAPPPIANRELAIDVMGGAPGSVVSFHPAEPLSFERFELLGGRSAECTVNAAGACSVTLAGVPVDSRDVLAAIRETGGESRFRTFELAESQSALLADVSSGALDRSALLVERALPSGLAGANAVVGLPGAQIFQQIHELPSLGGSTFAVPELREDDESWWLVAIAESDSARSVSILRGLRVVEDATRAWPALSELGLPIWDGSTLELPTRTEAQLLIIEWRNGEEPVAKDFVLDASMNRTTRPDPVADSVRVRVVASHGYAGEFDLELVESTAARFDESWTRLD